MTTAEQNLEHAVSKDIVGDLEPAYTREFAREAILLLRETMAEVEECCDCIRFNERLNQKLTKWLDGEQADGRWKGNP